MKRSRKRKSRKTLNRNNRKDVLKVKKVISVLMAMMLVVLGVTACGSKKDEKSPEATPEAMQKQEEKKSDDVYAKKIGFTIEMEDGGVMKGELYPDVAPITVDNFVKLAESKFYDGLIFHRVIPGFMIQGGGFDKDLNPKEAESIKGEFSTNGVENPLKHTRGVISMARTSVPDSASSQFFIMHEDYPSLDGQYAAFGKVTEGLDIIDAIASVETTTVPEKGMQDVPKEACVIKTITIPK